MGNHIVLALRVVLAMLLAGSVFVQTVMAALIAIDMAEGEVPVPYRVAFIALWVLGIAACQVVLVCTWRLVTMVRTGTVFSDAAFRYVDIVIRAIAAGAVLVFVFAVLLAPTDIAPGIVFLVSGVAVACVGVALVVLVMRMLLAQAVARDAEAAQMRSELDEVI